MHNGTKPTYCFMMLILVLMATTCAAWPLRMQDQEDDVRGLLDQLFGKRCTPSDTKHCTGPLNCCDANRQYCELWTDAEFPTGWCCGTLGVPCGGPNDNGCCHGYLCKANPANKGRVECVDDGVTCVPENKPCRGNAECCSNNCNSIARPEYRNCHGGNCLTVGKCGYSNNGLNCCDGYWCELFCPPGTPADQCVQTTSVNVNWCCVKAGKACGGANPGCCNDFKCVNGVCTACLALNKPCTGDAECCDGYKCNSGKCWACAAPGKPCTNKNPSECCSNNCSPFGWECLPNAFR